MTEHDQVEQVIAGKARRNVVTAGFIAALVLSLGLNVGLWYDATRRAQTAETSAVSIAQQVQQACLSQGSLDLDGRDLCDQADEVVEDPTTVTPPAPGKDGRDGVDGKDGIDGKNGKNGLDGKDGINGKDGADGIPMDGIDGIDGTDGVDGTNGTDGKDGADGTNGTDGADGRGIAMIECHSTGDWIITYTDGTTTTVPGPCRVVTPTPQPTATPMRR